MTDSRLLDSSVWLAYLFNGKFKEIIDSDEIFLLSALSLFEIRKKLAASGVDSAKINKSVEFVRKKSLVVDLNAEIAEKAVEVSLNHGLPAIDSLIYATSAAHSALMITLDNDFRGLKNIEVMSPI